MVDRVRCPALGWSHNSYKIWMQVFSVVIFGLWLQYRNSRDDSVRTALSDLYYISHDRQCRNSKRLSKNALWQKCFFMYCKYQRAQKLLQCSSSCKSPLQSARPLITL